jgi:hypothetical protein
MRCLGGIRGHPQLDNAQYETGATRRKSHIDMLEKPSVDEDYVL